MNPVSTPAAAFIAGIITSLHCCGMCGPLTCSALAQPEKTGAPPVALYHLCRSISYMLVGGLLALFGARAAILFSSRPGRMLPWAMALLFVLLALGLEKRIPQPQFLARMLLKLNFGARSRMAFGAWLGIFTPLLPCAPLYLVFIVTITAGSFPSGAVLMGAFAAGTLPLYWLAQTQFSRWSRSWSPATVQRIRQALGLVSAALLIWRACVNEGLTQPVCPLCH